MAKHTHSDRLERWLGKDHVERLSREFKNFYWPVAVHGVPGNVYVMPGGDFTGEIKAGQYFTKEDSAASVMRKILKRAEAKAHKEKALGVLADMIKSENTAALSVGAFASIDAVIAAATSGKGQILKYSKSDPNAPNTTQTRDVWIASGTPGAGAAGAAAPGGTVPTSATTGALNFKNLGVSNSGHYLSWVSSPTTPSSAVSLLLFDRLFMVAKTMNSTATEAVTGVPTRYQSSVTTDKDYIGGNFCYPFSPTTVLPATAHNWTVCRYTDQDGNTAQSFATGTGVSACAVSAIDIAGNYWFLPLAAGDVGVKALTQMQCSALVATGTIDFVIGHPIAINACPTANVTALDDGLLSALSLTPILDDACLTLLELPVGSTSSFAATGYIRTVSE